MNNSRSLCTNTNYRDPFPTRLREECVTAEDVKKLAAELKCSPQAINQYRTGISFPITEKLIKIANFYDCSLDYLIGLSDVRTPNADVQGICQKTGLSQNAVETISGKLKDAGLLPALETVIQEPFLLRALQSLSESVHEIESTLDTIEEKSFHTADDLKALTDLDDRLGLSLFRVQQQVTRMISAKAVTDRIRNLMLNADFFDPVSNQEASVYQIDAIELPEAEAKGKTTLGQIMGLSESEEEK